MSAAEINRDFAVLRLSIPTRCDSAIGYSTEERTAEPGEPLPPVSVLCCELDSGHDGPHEAQGQTWTRSHRLAAS